MKRILTRSTILIHRFTFLIFLLSTLFFDIETLRRLFQTTSLSITPEILSFMVRPVFLMQKLTNPLFYPLQREKLESINGLMRDQVKICWFCGRFI
jgi:hypothetical protein